MRPVTDCIGTDGLVSSFTEGDKGPSAELLVAGSCILLFALALWLSLPSGGMRKTLARENRAAGELRY